MTGSHTLSCDLVWKLVVHVQRNLGPASAQEPSTWFIDKFARFCLFERRLSRDVFSVIACMCRAKTCRGSRTRSGMELSMMSMKWCDAHGN